MTKSKRSYKEQLMAHLYDAIEGWTGYPRREDAEQMLRLVAKYVPGHARIQFLLRRLSKPPFKAVKGMHDYLT